MELRRAQVRALACDYDGTLARKGRVAPETVAALRRFKASGRKLLMVTGRELGALREVCPCLGLFDAVVCENGAVLCLPARGEERALAPGPSPGFLAALRARGVAPLSVGRVIVATTVGNEPSLREAIERRGVGWRAIRNKDSVMALPPGVDKASGLTAALAELGLSARCVIGVGDAENDETFLRLCGVAAAPANALPAVKAIADIVTGGEDGTGVAELIDQVLGGDA